MIKKAFITGITGFVGSHLMDYLLTKKIDVHGLARWRSPKGNLFHCLNKITLHNGDLVDFASLFNILLKVKPDCVFHLAAQSYIPYSFKAPFATLETNCMGTCNLLEAIRKIDDYDPIIHICSSSECYGQVKENEIPITEENPFRPASPYAVSKVCEDLLGYQYWRSWNMKILRTRLFSHTGIRRGEVFVVSNFAKQIAEIEIEKKDPIIYVGNLDSIRTFMDVRDAVRAYWLLVNKCPFGEVYNIGGDVTMTIREVLKKLLNMSTRNDIAIVVDQNRLRPSDVTLQIPCSDKFKKATGWKPEIDFNTTMLDTLNFWRKFIKSKQ